MCGMVFLHILNAKVVNYDDKHDRASLVVPEAGCDCTLVGPMFLKADREKVIG